MKIEQVFFHQPRDYVTVSDQDVEEQIQKLAVSIIFRSFRELAAPVKYILTRASSNKTILITLNNQLWE
jgi:hypothetical protein